MAQRDLTVQGVARVRIRLGDLLGELPEPTRVALMHELSERGPIWARLPDDWPQLPRRTLRQAVADRRGPPLSPVRPAPPLAGRV
jgi:hypothetical protein